LYDPRRISMVEKRKTLVYTVAKTPGFSEMQQTKRYL
jgi:hypothetical protein